MLCRSVSVAIFVFAVLRADAAALKGMICANEMRGEPMANVPVAADGANATTSDSFGKFTLEFPRKNPGDPVEVIPKWEGYLPVNDVQLQLELPARAEDKLLTIILCRESDREEMARRFYRLKSFDAVEETYRKRVKELEDRQQGTAPALAKLQQERDQAKAIAEKASERVKELEDRQQGTAPALAKLQQERDQAKATAEKASERVKGLEDRQQGTAPALAKLQQERDQASEQLAMNQAGPNSELYQQAKRFLELYQRAKRLFLDGNIAEAINLLDDEELRQLVDRSKKTLEGAVQGWLLEGAVQGWLLKAQLLTFHFRFEDAAKEYEAAIEAAPDSFEAHFGFAYFDQSLNRYPQAMTAYSRCLELARKSKDDVKLALTLNNLGVLDREQNRPEEARKGFEEALKIRRELALNSPQTHRPDVAQTLNNLGVLDCDQNRPEEARKEFEEALKIYRGLALQTYRPDVAATLYNLGLLDSEQNRLEEAWKKFEAALKIYRELALRNPQTYRHYVALALNNLGDLDRDQNRLEEARKEYQEALNQQSLEIATRLHDQDKSTAELQRDFSVGYEKVGDVLRAQGEVEEALKAFQQALHITQELAQQDPTNGEWLYLLGVNWQRIGRVRQDQNDLTGAAKAYEQAKNTLVDLQKRGPLSSSQQQILDRIEKELSTLNQSEAGGAPSH
jgi:tetratricopeptide (TPR) repeat protein